jgi:RNA polymerase primary sigma factor
MELHALRSEMVERNLYLVLINVERYAQSGASRHDLIQEGCVSLFRAVDGFDWRRGLLFRTYAVHWLNQAFRNYLYNNGHTVRVPVYLQKALKRINQATIRLGNEHASPSEIAAVSDLEENLVSAALSAARGSYSIDAEHIEGEEGSRLRDLLIDRSAAGPYSPSLEDVTLEKGLARALADLSERERFVLCMRFGIGYESEHTLAEVAEMLKVSVERVRQIQVRALSKLDTPTLRRELEPFVN